MIAPAAFFASVRDSLFGHSLSQRQVDGMNALLKAWGESGYTDDRWLAYALATAYHETGRAMWPVPEGGRGKGHPYGVALADGQIAYGRGFVQLTWAGPAPRPDNYGKADKELGLGGKLVANFDLALQPDIAAKILFRGMVEGWFTKFKLADYIDEHHVDYLHARKIVNGMDRADLIAGYALAFQTAITAGARTAADTTPRVTKPAEQADDDPIGEFFRTITGTISAGLGQVVSNVIPPSTAAQPVSETGPQPADALSEIGTVLQLAKFFLANASSFAQYATVLPHLAAEIPGIVDKSKQIVAGFEELVNDVKGGRFGEAGDDFQAIFKAVEDILTKVGVPLSTISNTVALMPSVPSVAGIAAVPELRNKAA